MSQQQMAKYKSRCHVGIPGFEFAEVRQEKARVEAKYLPSGVKLKDRYGQPVHYTDIKEYGRFEVVIDARVAIMSDSGEPSKRDLRKQFDMIDVVQGAIGEAVISNGSIWGVVTTGRTAWVDLRASDAGKAILMFNFRLPDIDTISLRLDGGLRRQGEFPVEIASLAPGGFLNLEARREYTMPGHKANKVKSSRSLFEAVVAATVDRQIEKTDDETKKSHLKEIAAGGHRDTSDPKEITIDFNPPSHSIQLDDHGLRVDRPHWPRPKAD